MIAVVGGGLAGLAAAHRLRERGREVRVFEASDDVGGLAATYETGGDPVERFYHHLSGNDATLVGLAEDLGLGDAVEWRYKSDAFYVDGVVHPMDTLWEIAAYPHLSLYDKFRLGMLTMGVDVRGGIPRFDAYDDIEDYEDVPVEAFLREHTTDRVFENFWKPLLAAKFGSRADDVSAAWLLGRVKFRGDRDLLRGERLGYFEGGFGRLLDALLADVGRETVQTGARVTDLHFDGGAVESLTVETGESASGSTTTETHGSGTETNGTSAGTHDTGTDTRDTGTDTRDTGTETHDVDAVVVATMPHVLHALTGYECAVDFQGTVCSVWSMDRSLTDAYWLNLVDDAPFGVFVEHTNFVPPERYGGEHIYYTASYVQDYAEDLWGMDDGSVEALWADGIADLFPTFDYGDVNWVRTARNPRTAPIYEVGYLEMVVPYDLSAAVGDGVYYAGMASRAQYPERSLDGAVEAGFAAADALVERE